jgi:hypothetical protein
MTTDIEMTSLTGWALRGIVAVLLLCSPVLTTDDVKQPETGKWVRYLFFTKNMNDQSFCRLAMVVLCYLFLVKKNSEQCITKKVIGTNEYSSNLIYILTYIVGLSVSKHCFQNLVSWFSSTSTALPFWLKVSGE